MLKFLELENYRGFKKYRVSDLARVNLLVGKNNYGKTSVLEAVYLLRTQGDIRAIGKIARQRGETARSRSVRSPHPDASHLFHGHAFLDGSRLELVGGPAFGRLTLRVGTLDKVREADAFMMRQFVDSMPGLNDADGMRWNELALEVDFEGSGGEDSYTAFLTNSDGAVYPDTYRLSRLAPSWNRDRLEAVQYISQASLNSGEIGPLWNKVVLRNGEESVVEAMRLLEPEMRHVVMLPDREEYPHDRGGIFVQLQGVKERKVPLGSFGEGMYRLFSLAVCLETARDGILLIDEIDTGLHYSIMEDLWNLVIETAVRNDLQVFATTHSEDCLRGLADVCRNRPELVS